MLDDEILDLIEACKVDLQISGLKNIDTTNSMVVFAIILYCKANFGYDNPDSDKLQNSYLGVKQKLILGDKGGVV